MSTPPPEEPEKTGPPLRAMAMVLTAAAVVFAGLGLYSLPESDAESSSASGAASASSSESAAGQADGPSRSESAEVSASAESDKPEKTTEPVAATTSDSAVSDTADADASDTTTTVASAGLTTSGSAPGNEDTDTAAGADMSRSDVAALQGDRSVRVYNNSTVEGLAGDTADELEAAGWTIADVANYDTGRIADSTVYYSDAPGEKDVAEALGEKLGVPAQPRFDGIDDATPGIIVIVTATE